MYKALSTTLILGMTAATVHAGEIVNDDFSGGSLDRTVWTTGGGFFVTANETLLISSFGTGFGFLKNDPNAINNSAPLNSQTGYASMDVLPNGEVPLEGNFLISTTPATNSANALLDIRFGDGPANDGSGLGAGSYEFVWNNSNALSDFSLPSGYTGTVGSGTWIGVKDGDTANPFFGQTATTGNTVNVGDAGTAYHFWVNQPNETMTVDNVVIWDSIPMLSARINGDYNDSGQVEQGDLDLVLQNWGLDTDANGVPAGWTNDLPSGQIEQTELDGVLQNWGNTAAPDFSGSAVPEPVSLALLGGLGLLARRR